MFLDHCFIKDLESPARELGLYPIGNGESLKLLKFLQLHKNDHSSNITHCFFIISSRITLFTYGFKRHDDNKINMINNNSHFHVLHVYEGPAFSGHFQYYFN